jgi:predicted transcriptional regulator
LYFNWLLFHYIYHYCSNHDPESNKTQSLLTKREVEVIREVKSNPTLTQVEVAKWLNMPVTTVKLIMGKKAFNKLSLLISLPA